jgi:putative inorganic carbon (HCO3(-)) transporter
VPGTSLLVDRLLIAAAVVLTCVVFTREALDPVNVIKLTALSVVAVALLAVTAGRIIRQRTVQLPASPAGAAALALGAAFLVAAVSAPVASTAILGAYGRNSGLIAYLAALVLFVVGLRVFGGGHARVLVGGVVFAGLFTAVYGLFQKAGIDAIPWNNPFNPIIAALGNPNFASAYLGIAAAVSAGGALYAGWAGGWRVLSGATLLLCVTAAGLSASAQGPIAAGAGLLVVAFAVALDLTSRRRRAMLAALGGLSVLAAGTLLLGAVAKAGPAARIFTDVGSQARTHYWDAAIQMFRDQPLLGVGLDHYGAFWRSTRSHESVTALGGRDFSDAAHSVPLQMLAQGGLVLGLAYAGFVLVVLVVLVRGLLRLRGAERMLLAAVGGGWTAYQVSSAVSIDQVPLLVLHFALAGAVIATAGAAGLREIRLPGASKPVVPHRNDAPTKRRLAAATRPRVRPLTSADLLALSLIALVASLAAWYAFVPLRANAAAKNGDRLLALGDGTAAFRAYDKATDLLPGQSFYWIKKGQLFQGATPPQLAQAQAAFIEAVDRDPYDVNAVKEAAALAETDGQLERSRALYQRAIELDPLNPDTLVAAASFKLRHSGAEDAWRLLEQAVEDLPKQPNLWATLGDARAVLGDVEGARQAYERALDLDPAQQIAVEGLDKLAGTSA